MCFDNGNNLVQEIKKDYSNEEYFSLGETTEERIYAILVSLHIVKQNI